MKKNFIIAIAALVAGTACSRVETVETPAQKISFEVANYVAQTRAYSSLDSEGYTTFTTNAWFFPGSGTNAKYMNNVAVKKGTSTWAPADDYYWPKTGYINFYSYAGTGTPTVAASQDMKTVTVEYANATIASTDNYLVADPALHYSSNTDKVKIDNETGEFDYATGKYKTTASTQTFTGVPTLFHHMLAKVAVIVKLQTTEAKKSANTTWTVKILNTEANPSNIIPVKKGTLTLKNTDAATAAPVSSWDLYNGSTKLTAANDLAIGWTPSATATDVETISFNTKTLTIEKNAVKSAQDSIAVAVRTVMPQLTSGVKFNFSYEVSAANASGTYMTEIIKVPETTLATAASSVALWGMNQIVIYTIIIDPVTEKITFDPAVVEWDGPYTATINYPAE